PFIDVSGDGSAKGYLAALDKVLSRVPPDVKIIPGHGEVTDVAGLPAFRPHIPHVIAPPGKRKAPGKPQEDFLKDGDPPGYKDFKGYKDRFKDNAAAAYDESR